MPSTPSPKKKMLLFGKVAVPQHSPSQLKISSSSISTSSPVTLGGSWRALQAKQHAERLEATQNLERMTALETENNRVSMINEDLSSMNQRCMRNVEKMRCSDIMLENKIEEAQQENDQLRGMHMDAAVENEKLKGRLISAEAQVASLGNVIENNSSMKKLLEGEMGKRNEKNTDLELKVQRLTINNKKLMQSLEDSQKTAKMYLKLKDDKDNHINLLVKEKNRLHDQITEMAKRYAKTNQVVKVAERVMHTKFTSPSPAPENQNKDTETNKPENDNDSENDNSCINLDDIVNDASNKFEPTKKGVNTDSSTNNINDGEHDEDDMTSTRRTASLHSAIQSIEKSTGSVRDRLLLNTIKKMSKELKRKDEEKLAISKDLERALRKNDDLSRRIRNFKGTPAKSKTASVKVSEEPKPPSPPVAKTKIMAEKENLLFARLVSP